jgi:hypothetical protein
MFTGMFKPPGAKFCAPKESADASAEAPAVYGCVAAGREPLNKNGSLGNFLLQ